MKPRHLLPAFGLFLFIVYPLSIGPVAWICYRHNPPKEPRALTVFYSPLATACRYLPWFEDALGQYISLWVPKYLNDGA